MKSIESFGYNTSPSETSTEAGFDQSPRFENIRNTTTYELVGRLQQIQAGLKPEQKGGGARVLESFMSPEEEEQLKILAELKTRPDLEGVIALKKDEIRHKYPQMMGQGLNVEESLTNALDGLELAEEAAKGFTE